MYATLHPHFFSMSIAARPTTLEFCNNADTEMAREYELEIDTQYLPLSIYTLDVDYTDVSVQVRRQQEEECKKGRSLPKKYCKRSPRSSNECRLPFFLALTERTHQASPMCVQNIVKPFTKDKTKNLQASHFKHIYDHSQSE